MKLIAGDADIERFQAVVAELKLRFRMAPELGSSSLAPTGEPYQVVSSHGLGEQGWDKLRFTAARPAIEAWRKHLMAYAAGKRGVVYWRMLPTLESESVKADRSDLVCKVYSRLLISDLARHQHRDAALGWAVQTQDAHRCRGR